MHVKYVLRVYLHGKIRITREFKVYLHGKKRITRELKIYLHGKIRITREFRVYLHGKIRVLYVKTRMKSTLSIFFARVSRFSSILKYFSQESRVLAPFQRANKP